MRLVTIGSLGASAALGLGALVVARLLLPATTGQAQATPRVFVSPMANAASVVVAAGDIPFGRRLGAGDLKLIQVPRSAAPVGAFTTVGQVLAQDHGGAPVTLTPIAAREPILPAKLSGPGARASVAAELAPGMRAYAISVTDATSVGGHALPGDRVDVVMMRDLTGASPHKVLESEVVIQNVRLLGVGLNADPTSTKPETAATATLEVNVRDAQKLSMASQLGALSLALRPTGLAELEATTPISSGGFGGGADHPGHARSTHSSAGAGSATGRILVVEGDGAPSRAKAPEPKKAPAA